MIKHCIAATILALISTSPVSAALVLWPTNGNFYDFVSAPDISWFDARDAAAAQSVLGVPGHLVTITSLAENNFITANLNTGQPFQAAWTAGNEPNDDGVWRWAVGPEAGIQFSNFATPTPPYNFANWAIGEPNNATPHEDFTEFNIGQTLGTLAPGEWGDGKGNPGFGEFAAGYLVEFETGAVPEPSTLTIWVVVALFAFGFSDWHNRPFYRA